MQKTTSPPPASSSPKPPVIPSRDEIRRRFTCLGCGHCCQGDGHVWLDPEDIRRLAAFFGLDEAQFIEEYATLDDAGYRVLKDQRDAAKSCIFLDAGLRCRAHEAKPRQCRDFPYSWRAPEIADFCAGWRAMLGLPPDDLKPRQ